MNKTLKQHLLRRRHYDQKLCEKVMVAVLDKNQDKIARAVEEMTLDRERNVEVLQTIIDHYGWPTLSMVGKDGSETAWLIAQHADSDIEFQERALSLIEKLLVVGEVPKEHYAYLKDRILVNQGKPQLFGTQFTEVEGKMVPHPILNQQQLDKRRSDYRLVPFEEYSKRFEGSNEDAIERSLEEGPRRSLKHSPDKRLP
jgi:hypothetical protein